MTPELSSNFSHELPPRPWLDSGISFGLHALLLVALNLTFFSSPRMSVALGDSPMEVKLVAASSEKNERSTAKRLVSDEGAVTLAKKEAAEESSSDESSQVGTVSGNGGQTTAANPNYFSNPAPVYPERARQMGQQGIVILLVEVTRDGTVKDLSVKESSGFSSLDLAAVRAVRQWVFEPARMGGMAVDARVEVPVRFQLEKARE